MANGIFTKGTGTLKSTTLVGAFAELALLTQTAERVAVGNETTVTANNLIVPNNIDIQVNLEGDTVTISATDLPIAVSLNSGNILIEAVDYLAPLNAVVPAIENDLDVTDSDLTKTTKLGALFELAQLIQEEESLISTEENPINNVTMTFDTDNLTASINATFAVTPSIDSSNGAIEVMPINYLA